MFVVNNFDAVADLRMDSLGDRLMTLGAPRAIIRPGGRSTAASLPRAYLRGREVSINSCTIVRRRSVFASEVQERLHGPRTGLVSRLSSGVHSRLLLCDASRRVVATRTLCVHLQEVS